MDQTITPAPPLRHLSFNHAGKRDHYYHFVLGVMLPLCNYLSKEGPAKTPVLVETCGPFDRILHELRLRRLIVTERRSHQRLQRTLTPELAAPVSLGGYDLHNPRTSLSTEIDHKAIRRAATWISKRLGKGVAKYQERLEADWTGSPRILVIDRAPPDPYYASALSIRKSSGAQRRRIGNHAEMVAAIASGFGNCHNVLLEGKSLAKQIALFQLADVVVAQHGAALVNTIWLRPDARVIEVAQEDRAPRPNFLQLAEALGFAHRFVGQDSSFGPVDIPTVIAALDAAVDPAVTASAVQSARQAI